MLRLVVLRAFPYTLDGDATVQTARPGQLIDVVAWDQAAYLIRDGLAQVHSEQPQAAMGPGKAKKR
jgi:hypothetical protein